MTTVLQSASRKTLELAGGEFFPVARYHPEMDIIQYLSEDCSYRAERVDGILTILWHPYEQRLVGISLKGFRFLFQRMKERSPQITDDMFLPLVAALQFALENGMAQGIMEGAEAAKRRDHYETAERFAATVAVPPKELKRAAA